MITLIEHGWVEARGKAILPGFVNTHTHLIGGMNTGLTEDEAVGASCEYRTAWRPPTLRLPSEEVITHTP